MLSTKRYDVPLVGADFFLDMCPYGGNFETCRLRTIFRPWSLVLVELLPMCLPRPALALII